MGRPAGAPRCTDPAPAPIDPGYRPGVLRVRPGDRTSFAASVERGLQYAVGGMILAKTLVFVLAAGAWDAPSDLQRGTAVVVVVLVTVAGGRCLGGRAGRLDVTLCSVAMVLAFLLPDALTAAVGAAESPIIHLAEPLLLSVVVGGRAFFSLTVLTVNLTYIGLRALGGADGALAGLQETSFLTGVAVAVFVLVTGLRAASDRAEATLQSQRSTVADRLTRTELEATTFIHDELVPTLLAGSMAPDRADTRRAAEQALRRLVRPRTSVPVARLEVALPELAARAGVAVTVHVVGASGPLVLPDRVRAALEGAVGEALRNVARHSGQRAAHVQVVQGPWSVEVVVRDDGRGFDPGVEGVGLRTSIIERMTAVGGTALVLSRPGSGTEVRLGWTATGLARRRSLAEENDLLLRTAVGNPARVVSTVCAWLATGYLVSALLLLVSGRNPVGSMVVAGPILLLTGALCWAQRHGPLGQRWLTAAAVGPALALAIALPAYRPSELGTLHTWIIELSSLPILAIAWTSTARRLALTLLPSSVVLTAVAVLAGIAGAEVPHLLLIQPLNVVFVALIASMLRRAGRAILDARDDDSAVTDLPARLRAILGGEYGAISAALGDQLAGRLDAPRAARLAQAARDSLYLRGDDHAALRHELGALRADGVVVRATNREAPGPSRRLAEILAEVRAGAPREVTITTFADRVSVVVIPAPPVERVATLTPLLDDGWSLEALDDAAVLGWSAPADAEPASTPPPALLPEQRSRADETARR